MASVINAVSGSGITQTADGSGVLKIQSNSVTTNALAWVNFAGASGNRNANYNVSSITRNGTGNYTLNFSTATSDANYTTSFSWVGNAGNTQTCYETTTVTRSTSAFSFAINSNGTAFDPSFLTVGVFGN